MYQTNLEKVITSINTLCNYVNLILYKHIGQPIAWCIADGASGEIVGAFLKSIQKRTPDSHVHVIMTDDGTCMIVHNSVHTLLILHMHNIIHADNTGWSAAREVFGSDVKHILCRWHVDRLVECIVHCSS